MIDLKQQDGVIVKIVGSMAKLTRLGVSTTVMESPSKNNKGIVNSDQTNRLPIEKWQRIVFRFPSLDLKEKIDKEQEKLNKQGIFFDTGFGLGFVQWELDWSLTVKETTA